MCVLNDFLRGGPMSLGCPRLETATWMNSFAGMEGAISVQLELALVLTVLAARPLSLGRLIIGATSATRRCWFVKPVVFGDIVSSHSIGSRLVPPKKRLFVVGHD